MMSTKALDVISLYEGGGGLSFYLGTHLLTGFYGGGHLTAFLIFPSLLPLFSRPHTDVGERWPFLTIFDKVIRSGIDYHC